MGGKSGLPGQGKEIGKKATKTNIVYPLNKLFGVLKIIFSMTS